KDARESQENLCSQLSSGYSFVVCKHFLFPLLQTDSLLSARKNRPPHQTAKGRPHERISPVMIIVHLRSHKRHQIRDPKTGKGGHMARQPVQPQNNTENTRISSQQDKPEFQQPEGG